jgi:hypothetical protein
MKDHGTFGALGALLPRKSPEPLKLKRAPEKLKAGFSRDANGRLSFNPFESATPPAPKSEQRAERKHQDVVAPGIGEFWAAQGGIYAGAVLDANGKPTHHLILCVDAKPDRRLAWRAAVDWAAGVRAHGFGDWSLPSRVESALFFANVRALFERDWYWTGAAEGSSYAWHCYFDGGPQCCSGTSCEGCAVAVRRLPINPSILRNEGAASGAAS